MKFSDFICRDAIRTNLDASEKQTVIRAMATSLLEAKKAETRSRRLDKILAALGGSPADGRK